MPMASLLRLGFWSCLALGPLVLSGCSACCGTLWSPKACCGTYDYSSPLMEMQTCGRCDRVGSVLAPGGMPVDGAVITEGETIIYEGPPRMVDASQEPTLAAPPVHSAQVADEAVETY
jgi:hypothetical protein